MNLFRRSTLLFSLPKYAIKICGAKNIYASVSKYRALYRFNVGSVTNYEITNNAVWSIKEGSQYASISQDGTLTIKSNALRSKIVIQVKYGSVQSYYRVRATYIENVTTSTDINRIVHPNGSCELYTTSIYEYEDGDTEEYNEIVYINSNNDEYKRDITINCKDGNVITQNFVKDEYQKDIVTNYEIDFSGSENNCKEFNGDGLDTEYIPFNDDKGFECNITFYAKKSEQPTPPVVQDKWDSSYHWKILSFKRELKPWPGFCIRFNSGSGSGLMMSVTSNNSNKIEAQLLPAPNNGLYSLKFNYDPNIPQFTVTDKLTDTVIYNKVEKFSSFENYGSNYNYGIYGVTIGYALYAPDEYEYRFSNMTLYEFSLKRNS